MAMNDYFGWASVEGVSSSDGLGWVQLDINGDVSWYKTEPKPGADQAVAVGAAVVNAANTWVIAEINGGLIQEVTYYG